MRAELTTSWGGNDSFEGDVGIFLGVIGGRNVIDPDSDAGSFGKDAELVSAKGIDSCCEGGLVDGSGVDEAAAMLIGNLAKSAFSAIDLVTRDAAIL